MIASPDDARLLFDRWKQDTPQLKIRLWASSVLFDAVGTVRDFSHGALELGGDSWRFTIPLDQVRFSFSDPREIEHESIRKTETSRYEFGLAIDLPNGDRVLLLELRTPEEEEES